MFYIVTLSGGILTLGEKDTGNFKVVVYICLYIGNELCHCKNTVYAVFRSFTGEYGVIAGCESVCGEVVSCRGTVYEYVVEFAVQLAELLL